MVVIHNILFGPHKGSLIIYGLGGRQSTEIAITPVNRLILRPPPLRGLSNFARRPVLCRPQPINNEASQRNIK